MASTIYTDGHSCDISDATALALERANIIAPHPGRGHDVGFGDWTLTGTATWGDVYAALVKGVAVANARDEFGART